MTRSYFAAALLCATSLSVSAHATEFMIADAKISSPPAGLHSQLFDEIAAADKALFTAFNTQDFETLKRFFAVDLEFYQDNEGLASYQQTMDDFKAMFAQEEKVRRELIDGSLEVYPIKNYGAIEVGLHKFCHVENGKDGCGTFKFVHVWRKSGQGWQLARVVSFNH